MTSWSHSATVPRLFWQLWVRVIWWIEAESLILVRLQFSRARQEHDREHVGEVTDTLLSAICWRWIETPGAVDSSSCPPRVRGPCHWIKERVPSQDSLHLLRSVDYTVVFASTFPVSRTNMQDTVPSFTWRNLQNLRKTSFKTPGLRLEIWTRELPNMEQES